MKIDITVNDRNLINNGSNTIPSGSYNDCYIKFHFEPGYGWESATSITAVFSRSETKAYRTNIQRDTYVAVPASVLTRPGNIYVSIIGYKGVNQVITTGTIALVVEYNSMSILCNNIPVPLNSCNQIDNDAYAQYVAAVNAAANRAEEAARQVEGLAVGWYTKEECDNRFAKRVFTEFSASESFDSSFVVPGTTPRVTVNALPVTDGAGSLKSPSPLSCIEEIIVRIAGPNSSVESGYSGLTLRYLTETVKDSVTLDEHGVNVSRRVGVISVKDNPGKWVTETQYMVSIVTCPEVDLGNVAFAMTNVGSIPLVFTTTSVTLELPPGTTPEELATIIIWYPMTSTDLDVISTSGLAQIPVGDSTIYVNKVINEETTPVANFSVFVEVDVPRYLGKYMGIVNTMVDDVAEIKKDVEDANEAVKQFETIVDTVTTLEDTVDTLSTSVPELTEKVTDIGSAIEVLTDTVATASSNISTLTSNVSEVKSDTEKLENTVNELDTSVTDLDGKVTASESTVSELNGKVTAAESKVSELDGKVTTAESSVSSLTSKVTGLESTVQSFDTDLDDVVENVNTALDSIEKVAVIKQVLVSSGSWVSAEDKFDYQVTDTNVYVLAVYDKADTVLTPATFTVTDTAGTVKVKCDSQADRIVVYCKVTQ